ncbi:MAG TPA: hypothetical protein VKA15_02955 [Isosphaeraceae bacterium]|nr:hypothetical protein [Isosphaeraceae bacterium]
MGALAMAIHNDVRAVYEYLTSQVLPGADRPTVTYGQIERETGVPIGEYGGYIGQVLGEISRRCSDRRLAPLTSIFINATDGIPGSGYFVEMAQMLQRGNPARWRIDLGIERWDQRPTPRGFDKDLERWNYRQMIEENQRAVWAQTDWPQSI